MQEPATCHECQRTLGTSEPCWADDVKVIGPGDVRIVTRYTCDECAGVTA